MIFLNFEPIGHMFLFKKEWKMIAKILVAIIRKDVLGNSGVRKRVDGALPLSRQEGRGSRAQNVGFVIIQAD